MNDPASFSKDQLLELLEQKDDQLKIKDDQLRTKDDIIKQLEEQNKDWERAWPVIRQWTMWSRLWPVSRPRHIIDRQVSNRFGFALVSTRPSMPLISIMPPSKVT